MMTIRCSALARALLPLWILLAANALRAETPEWIWNDNNGAKPVPGEVRYFRKKFVIHGEAKKATLSFAADDELQVFINGRRIAEASGWSKATRLEVTKDLEDGENVIAIRGTNEFGDAAAVIAMLEVSAQKRSKTVIVTDATWLSSTNSDEGWTKLDFAATNWTKALSLGKAGVKPWGDIFTAAEATPADKLTLLPGFKAELIRSSEPWEGSWICMTVDPKGRLIISPQEGTRNLLRVTLSAAGQVEEVETIDQPVGGAMGLLYAFDSLYLNGSGPNGLGLYRLHYNHDTDKFDSVQLLKLIQDAGGEHGSHAVVLGPDQHLYIVSGNFTKVPKNISPESPHRNFAEDQLLPRAEDGNGFGIGVKPPGGFILRLDKDGKEWELYCAGMRNTYDFAFNPDGEMFGFDSDMEWDWGMPWYRPIRFCHLVSAGDYGFREGSGKWPKYYPDSLPSMVDVGVGSPTGMKFGTDSNFPGKYKTALYALDWAYGRIFAVFLTPKGATYDATYETVIKGKPLNVTDLEFGKDGAMYFITGGRGTQSGLYRVTYSGPTPAPEAGPSRADLAAAAKARELRHQLEAFQGKQNPKAVDFAWPYLDSNDRFIRYAARIAIESQPVAEWQDRALAETRTNAALTALLALARCGGEDTQLPLLLALAKFKLVGASEEMQLDKLRVMELSFIRQGRPYPEIAAATRDRLDGMYPAKSEWLNRELCELLIYLQAPDVVGKTLALLEAAPTQEEQFHYLLHLRKLQSGWTKEQHERYFSWFNRDYDGDPADPNYQQNKTNYPWAKRKGLVPQRPAGMVKWFTDADREYSDGASYPNFIAGIRKDAIASLTEGDRAELAGILEGKKAELNPAAIVQRKFVKDWKMTDLQPMLDQLAKGRQFARGKELFTSAQCVECHRFANAGGAVGPELTAISSRYGHREILESILEPSKVISEQYINTLIIKKDGDDLTGRVVEENDQKLVLVTDPRKQTKVEVMKADIDKRLASKISPMPEGLVNNLTQDEILDLIAYLESGGKETAAAFNSN